MNRNSSVQACSETNGNAESVPAIGNIDFGSLRGPKPISEVFGFDRGRCIDRWYIERFLAEHEADVRGHVLEIAEDQYTKKFGKQRVTKSDVLHATSDNRKATIVGDLTDPKTLPPNLFDCIILTQTLQHIYDIKPALRTLNCSLAPGGVVLATAPGISQISRYDMDRWGDYWRFTTLSIRRLFEEWFDAEQVQVEAFGNALIATAFLQGLVVEDVSEDDLHYRDPNYELIITVRAQREGTPS